MGCGSSAEKQDQPTVNAKAAPAAAAAPAPSSDAAEPAEPAKPPPPAVKPSQIKSIAGSAFVAVHEPGTNADDETQLADDECGVLQVTWAPSERHFAAADSA